MALECLVTGAAGFIGSTLVDRLLADGHRVVGIDDLSAGGPELLSDAGLDQRFQLVVTDLADRRVLLDAMEGCEVVFHLAANADVRRGLEHPARDLERNTIATHHVLEAMRGAGTTRIALASTGSVYGEPDVFPTPEGAPFPTQTSLYGASKVAAEALVSAYAAGFGFEASIFRFVSVLGRRYRHGHVIDFCRQLAAHPDRLDVLGDGNQRKSYLAVDDCVDAIVSLSDRSAEPVAVYNVGTDETCTVRESIRWICDRLDLDPTVTYSGGRRGWVGDSPLIHLDCSRARRAGWEPTTTIRSAVDLTVDDLVARGIAPTRGAR